MPCSIPVHVISLPRRSDRRAWMKTHLQQIGLPCSFFDATDARDLHPDQLARCYDPARFALHNPGQPEMTIGLLACTLSHTRLWQQIAASGTPWTLVLEDDAVFTHRDPTRLLESIAAAAGPNDVVLLNSRTRGVWMRDRIPLGTAGCTLYHVNAETFLAAAYLISLGAAQRLTAAVSRDGLVCASDWWHRRDGADWSRIIPIRVAKPDPAEQHTDLGSDIASQNHNNKYFEFVHDNTHRAVSIFSGLVRDPRNPRHWLLFVSRLLRRIHGYYFLRPRCVN